MRHELLDALVAHRRNESPVVLVRGLTNDRQFFVTNEGSEGDTEDLDPAIVSVARAALDKEGAQTLERDGEQYLLQTLVAAPRLVVIGAGQIAQALVPMAQRAGYGILLIDPRKEFANSKRFPGIEIDNRWPHDVMPELRLDVHSAVVALSHNPKIDEPALQAAMDSDAFYIGALGSSRNHARREARLRERGYPEQQIARIFGPIGLPLGGRSPAEIAIATLAQIVQQRHTRLGA